MLMSSPHSANKPDSQAKKKQKRSKKPTQKSPNIERHHRIAVKEHGVTHTFATFITLNIFLNPILSLF